MRLYGTRKWGRWWLLGQHAVNLLFSFCLYHRCLRLSLIFAHPCSSFALQTMQWKEYLLCLLYYLKICVCKKILPVFPRGILSIFKHHFNKILSKYCMPTKQKQIPGADWPVCLFHTLVKATLMYATPVFNKITEKRWHFIVWNEQHAVAKSPRRWSSSSISASPPTTSQLKHNKNPPYRKLQRRRT